MPPTSEAILFPGQGAQFPGMGKAWAEAFPAARAIFDQADEALGFSLSEATFQEEGDGIHRTDLAQPAILTTSVAILSVLVDQGLDPGPEPRGKRNAVLRGQAPPAYARRNLRLPSRRRAHTGPA